jgi:hypothetical protein
METLYNFLDSMLANFICDDVCVTDVGVLSPRPSAR